MGFKLAAFDMDGTLLTNQHIISENTKNKIKELQKMGISIALISGRNINSLMNFAKELGLEKGNNYLSCLNGTELYSFKTKKLIREREFNNQEINYLLQYTKNNNYRSIICKKDGFIQNQNIFQYIKAKLKDILKGIRITNGFEGHMKDTTYNFSFTYDGNTSIDKYVLLTKKDISLQTLDKIKQDLNTFEVSLVGQGWIEITPYGVNKGNSIEWIANDLNCTPSQIIAFGDSENDISMFKKVKYSIAMKNGMDSLKQFAFDITDTNQNDGVALALDKYIITPKKQELAIIQNPNVEVIIDRPKGFIDRQKNIYPINYGYIPSLYAGDGEEQDAYIIDSSIQKPIEKYQGNVVAIIIRNDDVETKWVVSNQELTLKEIQNNVNFIEQYFDSEIKMIKKRT